MANLPKDPGASKSEDRSSVDDLMGDDLPRQLGRYMLLKRIARGGMGEVLLASTMGIEGAASTRRTPTSTRL